MLLHDTSLICDDVVVDDLADSVRVSRLYLLIYIHKALSHSVLSVKINKKMNIYILYIE